MPSLGHQSRDHPGTEALAIIASLDALFFAVAYFLMAIGDRLSGRVNLDDMSARSHWAEIIRFG